MVKKKAEHPKIMFRRITQNNFYHGSRFSKLNLAVFALIFAGIGGYLFFSSHAQPSLISGYMPLISRGLPAFSSSAGGLNGSTTSALNNSDYTATNGTNYGYTCPTNYPCFVAYNLSSLPAVQQGQLQRIYSTWLNEVDNTRWDYASWDKIAEGVPKNYTIDVACQNLATSTLPNSGWVTKVTTTGNTLHSRSSLINMVDTDTGNPCHNNYNWIRINVTDGDDTLWNVFQMKWDIWDASQSYDDTWMFYGDSITVGAGLDTDNDYVGETTLAKMINSWNANYYPSIENGGMGGWTAGLVSWAGTTVDSYGDSSPWFPKNPSHFVVVGLGTNDCNNGYSQAATYTTDLTNTIDGIMNPSDPNSAGRIVIIPTFPASPALRSGTNSVWESGSVVQVSGNGGGPACLPVIPQVIAAEQAKYGASRVLAGPDLWSITSAPGFHWSDDLHPYGDAQGYGAWKSAWAQWMEANIYGTSPAAPTVTLTASPTGITTGNSSTLTWSSTNATSCSATSPSGWTSSTATSGNQSVSPTSTTTYTLTCTGSGGSTPASATVTVGTADVTPPSVPTGLGSSSKSTTSIDLSWNASTDPTVSGAITSGLAGYKIYRNGSNTPLTTTNQLSYTDSGLSPNTTYSYQITAYDNTGNESAKSTAFNVTTYPAGSGFFDHNLGSGNWNVNQGAGITSESFTTTAAASSSTRVVITMSYWDLSTKVSSVTVGGTQATLDKRAVNNNTNDVYEIWSLPESSGLASGSPVVINFPTGQIGGLLAGAMSIGGVDLTNGGGVTTTASSTNGSGTSWTSGTVSSPGAIVIGGAGDEGTGGSATATVTTGTKVHDVWQSAAGQGFTDGYNIGGTSIAGTFSASSPTITGAAVAYTAASSGSPVVGDINGDNSVNIFDLSLLLSSYGATSRTTCVTNTSYTCDLNSDNTINVFDLSILLSHYGT